MHNYDEKPRTAVMDYMRLLPIANNMRPQQEASKSKSEEANDVNHMPKKQERGLKWILGLAILIIGFFIWIGYVFSASHLRFIKALGLQSTEFDYPLTNSYNTIKWWFILFLPNVLGPVPLVILALLLHYMYITETTENDVIYSRLHLIVTILYIGVLVTGLVYIGIDWANANTIVHGADSLATDFRFCCSVDVLTPPGATPGCAYIQTCGSTPISTHQLVDDPYFILTFAFNMGLIVLSILQAAIGSTLFQ